MKMQVGQKAKFKSIEIVNGKIQKTFIECFILEIGNCSSVRILVNGGEKWTDVSNVII